MATGDTVLTESRLTTRPDGLAIVLTLPRYRSIWLSSVSEHLRIGGWRTDRAQRTTCWQRSAGRPLRRVEPFTEQRTAL